MKLTVPTAANGKVYIGTHSTIEAPVRCLN